MADATLKDLNYGHPGTASYDVDTAEWLFARQLKTKSLKQLRTWRGAQVATTLATAASIQFPTPQVSANSTSIRKQVKSLLRDHPQLAAAVELVPELALVSAAIQSTTSLYDPLVGSLLSFGSITLDDRHEGPRQIAALPTGETGNILSLAILNKERLGWALDRSVWVDGPSLKDAECGYWNEEAAPIQQVSFSQSEDRSTILAVRLPSRTVLLRPVYHKRHQPVTQSPYYELPPSRIDAHPILNLNSDQTGGFSHVDVTFNPDFQFQFGIVDRSSTWSVWDIEHRLQRDAYTASCLLQGPIDPSGEASATGEDGWARILWVGDVNTLAVCNRRQLSIVSIKVGSFDYLHCPKLFSKRSTDWILDLKRHPGNKGRFFVLTSTHLMLMAITTSSEALDASVGEAGAHTLMSWRHYRGLEDFTLRLSVQTLTEDEFSLILHSRLNGLAQFYVFDDHRSTTTLSTFDPTLLRLAGEELLDTIQIHMEPMPIGESSQEAYHFGPGRSYMARGIKFYRIFVLQSDLSVHEFVVHSHKSVVMESDNDVPTVEDFKRSLVRHPRRDASRREVIEEEDSNPFIPDGLQVMDGPMCKIASQLPTTLRTHHRASVNSARDYTLLYSALDQDGKCFERPTKTTDIATLMTKIQQMLITELDPQSPLDTLMELADSSVQVSDVDEASLKLRELFNEPGMDDATIVWRIGAAHLLEMNTEEEPTMAGIYDTILQNWIASLPPDVPVRIRQHKEQLARRVAVEVLLACCRIRGHESQELMVSSQRGPSQNSGVTLPILPSKPGETSVSAPSQWPDSLSLPTPPHSSLPSSSLPPSSPPLSPYTPSISSDPKVRLGRHLHIREPSLTPTIIATSVAQVLTHWQSGTDPHKYDWDATERALRPEHLDETSQQQREKERKRRERRQKRQQREDELMRAQVASQQPVVFPRSSPGPMLGGLGSSSQAPSQSYSQVPIPGIGFMGPEGFNIMAPQSQVEPGRFGGRPDKKKKKKGRVSGF